MVWLSRLVGDGWQHPNCIGRGTDGNRSGENREFCTKFLTSEGGFGGNEENMPYQRKEF
jgi:hypothetical protein